MNRMHLLFWISCVVEIGLIGAEANDDVSASTVQFRNFSPKNEVVFQYDRLTSTTSRLGFLVTEAQKETEAGDEAASWEKATAIRMLGKLHATDAVEILLNELAFFDIKSKTYPACFAVIDIGEPVVSNLLERAIEASPMKDYRVLDVAGEALYQILGRQGFREFMELHKHKIEILSNVVDGQLVSASF